MSAYHIRRLAYRLLGEAYLKAKKTDGYHAAFDRHKCIFIHVPKAAGTSVAQSMFGHLVSHRPAYDYFIDNPRKFREYYKFTFVRNPWDRLVSAYHYLKAGGMDERDEAWAQAHLSSYATFEEFVYNWVNHENIRKKNHFRPQIEFLNDGIPGSRRIMVDFVGRVERIDEDLGRVAHVLDMNVRLSRTNTSSRVAYQTYYSGEMEKIIRNVYADDIEVFGYTFD